MRCAALLDYQATADLMPEVRMQKCPLLNLLLCNLLVGFAISAVQPFYPKGRKKSAKNAAETAHVLISPRESSFCILNSAFYILTFPNFISAQALYCPTPNH